MQNKGTTVDKQRQR